MDIEDLLAEQEQGIVDEAFRRIVELERYRRDGAPATRRRVEALYRQVATAVRARDVTELRAHARQLARERMAAGFELTEVEAALSALEDAIHDRALALLPAYDLSWGHGLVATALAHGRDAMRRSFDPSAARAAAPYPDLSPLFRGASRLAPCPAGEMVAAA